MKLILVRHGETVENAKRVIQGHNPGNLNERGKLQAEKVANRLKDEKIDAIFSSDLKRAKDTTKEISKFHKTPVHYLKEVREMHRGVFDGQMYSEEYAKLRDKVFEHHEVKYPNGESIEDVKKRAVAFLEMLHQKYSDKTVVLVSHGTFLKMLIHLLEKEIFDLNRYELGNASITVLEFDEDKKHKIHLINDTSHLEV